MIHKMKHDMMNAKYDFIIGVMLSVDHQVRVLVRLIEDDARFKAALLGSMPIIHHLMVMVA